MRINFDLDDELAAGVQTIPKGIRSEVFRKVLRIIVAAGEIHGKAAYGAILDDDFNLSVNMKEHQR